MTNVVLLHKSRPLKSPPETNIGTSERILSSADAIVAAEQLRDRLATITDWLESFQKKLAPD